MAVVSVPIVVTVEAPSLVVVGTGTASAAIRVSVVPPGILSGAQSVCIGSSGSAAQWAPVVMISGVDVAAQVIGEIRIDAEEGAARIAELTLRPPGGTVLSLPLWTGLPITIDVADISTGTARYAMRLFTGVIDTPSLNQPSRTIGLRCTDDLQGRCDGMSNAALAALIGGYASPAVFDAAAAGWSFAQDRLSTVAASLDISPEGALRLTPWAAKDPADILLDTGLIGDGSLSTQIADRAGLINEVLVEFDYRFPRVKAEGYPINFQYVDLTSFATHVSAGDYFLQRAQVESAISAAGGNIESITYTALPTWIIAVGAGFWSPGPYDATLCMGFTALVSFDYAQSTTEQHRISVGNALSISAIGLRRETISGALEGVYPDIVAAETNIRIYKGAIGSIPPADIAPVVSGKTKSADVSLSPESDRSAANAAMAALIAVAKTRIWASHRRNSVSASVPLIPAIDVDKTISVDADGVLASGKCTRVTHRLSPDSGEAISEFSIALCAVAGVGITHDEDPTTAPAGTAAEETAIATAPVVTFTNGAAEDRLFSIDFPGVEAVERANATSLLPSSIAAPLAEDVFTVTI